MDIVFHFPTGHGQLKYLIVVINYFTKWIEYEYLIVVINYFPKWIEYEPLEKIMDHKILSFINQNTFTILGIPKAIITDREWDTFNI